MSDLINRQAAIDSICRTVCDNPEICESPCDEVKVLEIMPSAQPETHDKRTEMHSCDWVSRQVAIDAVIKRDANCGIDSAEVLKSLPSAQLEQRYTEEELRVFQHGISLSLLSKRSAQHWQYDEDTATEIKFLERLYEKVNADMRGEQDGKNT